MEKDRFYQLDGEKALDGLARVLGVDLPTYHRLQQMTGVPAYMLKQSSDGQLPLSSEIMERIGKVLQMNPDDLVAGPVLD